MKKLINKWPALFIVTGLILLIFMIQDRANNGINSDNQSSQQQIETTTAVQRPEQMALASPTPSPLVTQTKSNTLTPVQTPPPQTADPTLSVTAAPSPSPVEDPQLTATTGLLTMTPAAPLAACRPDFCIPRFGASGKIDMISAAYQAGLPIGAYFNWDLLVNPQPVGTADFWQMIRVSENGIRQEWTEVERVIEANPGAVWIIGNEPDILWQDNTTAEKYAGIYHMAYTFIKERDSSARIATAGVGQPTPLRLAYLDTVLATYQQSYGQSMPVDIWTIHNFILREERDSWGVGIPPGMVQESGQPVNQGVLYEIDDHDDLAIFQQNLVDFRQWMSERGYRDRPLAVTEFGILMPGDFGFPPPALASFLTGTFDFLLQASSDTIGYPDDDNRLVQWAFWYSVYDPLEFPTGNLFDPETGELTTLGNIYTDYINGN